MPGKVSPRRTAAMRAAWEQRMKRWLKWLLPPLAGLLVAGLVMARQRHRAKRLALAEA